MNQLHFLQPAMLWALPLVLLPLWRHGQRRFAYPGLADWPRDRASEWLRYGVRGLMMLTLLCLVLGAASPYLEGGTGTRVGEGAEIVVVLDRSGSMTEPLAGQDKTQDGFVSKIAAARQALLEFMNRRPGDTFGVVAFNASPIPVAPLSADRDIAAAALQSAQARSVGFTALARALAQGLRAFADRPLTATRVLLLVSDGDATIDKPDREALRQEFQQQHAQLIWIYVRGEREPSIFEGKVDSASLSMHRVFGDLGVAYQAFEVTNVEALQKAVREVGRLTNLPTRYEVRLPRRDLATPLHVAAMLLLAFQIGIRHLEITAWRPSSAA